MRLQLDPAVTGSEIARSNEPAPAESTGRGTLRAGLYGAGGDSIRISGPSSTLRAMSAQRTERIQQLTAQVQAGTYDVPALAITRAMVAHAASWSGSEAQ